MSQLVEYVRARQRVLIPIAIGVLVLAFVAFYFSSPYMAFAALKDAAKSRDRDKLEQVVDFPAVRENLKSELSARMMKSVASDADKNTLAAGIASLLGPAVIDRMVDSLVTPDLIAMLVQHGKMKAPGQLDDSKTDNQPIHIHSGYRTLDRFRVVVTRGDMAELSGLALTMERRGLFSWKLIRIDVPESAPTPSAAPVPATTADTEPAAPAAVPDGLAENPHPIPMPTPGGGGDTCEAMVLAPTETDEQPVDDPSYKVGQEVEAVTQYRVVRATGEAIFCQHGGGCYDRYGVVNGQHREILRLTNCHIGKKSPPIPGLSDDGADYYDLVVDRSKLSQTELDYMDVNDALSSMGMCSACSSNAAALYVKHPDLKCAKLVASALNAHEDAKHILIDDTPSYCQESQ